MPSATHHEGRCEAAFPIDAGQRGLEVKNPGLDLDHEERSRRRVPGQKVNGSALSVSAERELGQQIPARTVQDPGACIGQLGVSPIEQPIHLPTAPTRLEVELDAHRGRDRAQGVDGQTRQLSCLNQGNR